MIDYQVRPSAAAADLVAGKAYTPGPEPYRRPTNAPTGVTNRIREYMNSRDTFTADDAAVDLRVGRKAVIDAVKNLLRTGEVELAEKPVRPSSPRVYRAAPSFEPAARSEPRARKIVRVIDPMQLPAGPLLPPAIDAIADMLATQTGKAGTDPVSAALNRVLLAAEEALAAYLKHFHDPIRDHLQRQVDEARAAITAWEDKRRDQKR